MPGTTGDGTIGYHSKATDSDDDDAEVVLNIKKKDGANRINNSMDSTSISSLDGDGDDDENDISGQARKKLLTACVFIFLFMIAEIVGGVISGSLAIMTDALHLLTDLVGFGISIAALTLSRRPATRKLTFGWYRAEILGALVSVILVWAVTTVLVMLAIQRIMQNSYDIDAKIMLITSGLGVCINLVIGVQLQHGHSHGGHGHSHGVPKAPPRKTTSRDEKAPITGSSPQGYGATNGNDAEAAAHGHSHSPGHSHSNHSSTEGSGHAHAQKHKDVGENMNVRAAIMNMLGDLCQSVGVMVASLIIFFVPEYKIADPICTFLFSVFVLVTTINIMRDVFHILMEGAPDNVDYERMKKDLIKIPGVRSVHHVRIWALTASKVAMAAHIDYVEEDGDEMNYAAVLKECRRILRKKYGITDLTLQIEVEPDFQIISTD